MPNKIDLSKRIEELISNMDKESLADAVRILGKGKDAKKTVEALESAMSRIDVDFDSVKREALYALNIDEEDFFRELNRGNSYGGIYRDSGEIAADMILEYIEPFRDDVKKLMTLNRTEDANTVVRAVAAALRESESSMVEWAVDFPGGLADNLEECMREGNPADGFEW